MNDGFSLQLALNGLKTLTDFDVLFLQTAQELLYEHWKLNNPKLKEVGLNGSCLDRAC